MDRRLLAVISVTILLLTATAPVALAAAGPAASAKGVYIVHMEQDPAVAYSGGISGLAATKPAKGAKIDPNSARVKDYVSYLTARHDAALASVGGGKKLYDYVYAFNGFASRVTAAQAARLALTPGVVFVEKQHIDQIETSTTPAFLGLSATGGLWDQLGGVGSAGEDVIIGVVDTGIWPEHPSFADRNSAGKRIYQQIPGWHGKCTPGEQFNASNCNQKLIGAQYFNAGFGTASIADRDFLSPRDWNGHGSHTSSTAGGNNGVPATGPAAVLGSISGMAPRARLAMYKVCWEDAGTGGCATSDSVEAIDQAVADGVDVINFSISGTSTNYLDAVEVAFMFAAQAGIFVATSAGNSGPTVSTVAHISPWLTSTAASTHSRAANGSVTLGNGDTYYGASVTAGVGPAQLRYAGDVKTAAAALADAKLCFPGTLDPALVTGKIIVCDRGVNARTEKSQVVKDAGGVGMVLANTSANSLNADFHVIPTVHVSNVARTPILAYIAANPATASATIAAGVIDTSAEAPFIASFSSRGPSRAGGGDVLKPDLSAPGVDILAAVAPPGNNGRLFDLLSGTSMSSPHVAGIAALLKDLHPGWSPMAIKSSLMTTGYDLHGTVSPFNQGAGHVAPNSAADPGLVYDHGFQDWRSFLKGQRLCNFCFGAAPATAIDASDLNQASIAIGDLAGVQTITRTVKNVSSSSEDYTSAVSGLSGVSAVVTPSAFTIASGGSQTYTVQFTRTTAALGAYSFGNLTWTGNHGHSVRSPLVIKPVAIAAPAALSGATASGSAPYTVKVGYTGTLTTSVRGLIPAATDTRTVVDDPTSNFNTANPDGNQGIQVHTIAVPAGTTYARFSLFDAFTDGADDLDLYVYSGATLVGSSGGGTAAEEVNLVSPAAGNYKVYVHGWQTDGPDAIYTLFSWTLGSTAAGNLTVVPASTAVTTGDTVNVTASWTGLTVGTKYLGAIDYGNGTNTIGTTIVRIDPVPPTPAP